MGGFVPFCPVVKNARYDRYRFLLVKCGALVKQYLVGALTTLLRVCSADLVILPTPRQARGLADGGITWQDLFASRIAVYATSTDYPPSGEDREDWRVVRNVFS